MIRCLECGDEINPSDEFITEEGDYLCKRCMWKYQDLAYRMMVKSFEQLPPLYRKAFATPNMPALGDFCNYVEDYK